MLLYAANGLGEGGRVPYLRRKEQELAAAAEREIPGPLQVGK
jgi:hypothetical protein